MQHIRLQPVYFSFMDDCGLKLTSLCSNNEAPRHEDGCGSRYTAPPFLTLVLGRGEWSASRSDRITPLGRAPRNLWIGGCVGSIAGLDPVEERKFFVSAGNRIPALQPIVRPYTDWAVTPKCHIYINILTTVYCGSSQVRHTYKWKPHINL
jgi:hypothetical protein